MIRFDLTRTEQLAELKQAEHHFDAACVAALKHDDAAFRREMDRFNAIKETWKPTGSGDVANNDSPVNQ